MPKSVFIIGLFLVIFPFIVLNNYEFCHSDFSIAGYDNSQNCLPVYVRQLKELSLFLGIGCIIWAAILKETSEGVSESPISILKVE